MALRPWVLALLCAGALSALSRPPRGRGGPAEQVKAVAARETTLRGILSTIHREVEAITSAKRELHEAQATATHVVAAMEFALQRLALGEQSLNVSDVKRSEVSRTDPPGMRIGTMFTFA